MKRIIKSVAKQTGQLAKDVAKQSLKDIGEIPKSAPRQAVGQNVPSGTSASKKKLIKMPSFEVVDVKKEVEKVPKTAARQVAGSPIVEAMQQSDGKTQLVSEEEEKELETARVQRLKKLDAEMARLREERKKKEEERLKVQASQVEKITKPADPIQLPESPPRAPRGLQEKRSPEIRKSKH